jgi:SanA protein
MKITKKKFLLASGVVLLITTTFLVAFPLYVLRWGGNRVYIEVADVNPKRVAIVFGAGVKRDGTPSDALRDRLVTAEDLYKDGKVEKILVSGDNRFVDYNEPDAMREFLLDQGIPGDDIVADYAGRRTFDTCIRAKTIFQVDEAILVTQGYHLARALWTCNHFDVASHGISATHRNYFFDEFNKRREVLAIYRMFIDLYLWEPNYIGGGVEPIN